MYIVAMPKPCNKNKAYTVVEILIVISILAVLLSAVFLVSVYRARQLKDKVKQSEDIRTQGQLQSNMSLSDRLQGYRDWMDQKSLQEYSKTVTGTPLGFRVGNGIRYDASGSDPEAAAVMAKNLLRQALLKSKEGDLKTALTLLKEASILDPLSPSVYTELARVALLMDHTDFALKQIGSVIAMEPEYADAYLVKARILIKKGRMDQARKDLDKAAELKNTNAEIYLIWSEFYQKDGNTVKAQEYADLFQSMM